MPGYAYVAPEEIYVEGDASSASYFLAAGRDRRRAGARGGVGRDSIQGDVRFAEVLEQMGAQRRIRADDWIEVSAPAGKLKPIDWT